MSQNEHRKDQLAAVNSATMGTTMPVVTLPDGQKVQTGTVGALIINIKLYDELMGQPDVNNERKLELESMLAAALPVLKKASKYTTPHFFLTADEWCKLNDFHCRYV